MGEPKDSLYRVFQPLLAWLASATWALQWPFDLPAFGKIWIGPGWERRFLWFADRGMGRFAREDWTLDLPTIPGSSNYVCLTWLVVWMKRLNFCAVGRSTLDPENTHMYANMAVPCVVFVLKCQALRQSPTGFSHIRSDPVRWYVP